MEACIYTLEYGKLKQALKEYISITETDTEVKAEFIVTYKKLASKEFGNQ